MNRMGSGDSMKPVWVLAGAIGMYVLLGMAIRRVNKRQRPILWAAVVVTALMVLLPPWLGEKGEWANVSETPEKQDSRYVRSDVPMGYSLILLPPKPSFSNTNKPMGINWKRLLLQIGVVAFLAAAVALTRRAEQPVPVPAGSSPRAEGGTADDQRRSTTPRNGIDTDV